MAEFDISRPVIVPYVFQEYPRILHKPPITIEVRDLKERDQALTQGWRPTTEAYSTFPQTLAKAQTVKVANDADRDAKLAEGWFLTLAAALAPVADEADADVADDLAVSAAPRRGRPRKDTA